MKLLPKRRALTNIDIQKFAIKHIPHWRGVFMRDRMPSRPHINECGVVNLDSANSIGSHWVAYKKRGNVVHYFDSFGDLAPPIELVQYFHNCEIRYNYKTYQSFDTVNCGHLCLEFLL